MDSPLLSCTHWSVHSCCANQSCAMLHAACAEGVLSTQPSSTRFMTVSITVNAMTCVIHGSVRSAVPSWNGIEQFFVPVALIALTVAVQLVLLVLFSMELFYHAM